MNLRVRKTNPPVAIAPAIGKPTSDTIVKKSILVRPHALLNII
jgi:hypothetical protein